MRTIKVYFENGDNLLTSINGTDDEIRRYYVGNECNLGTGDGGDLMTRAVRVEFMDNPAPVTAARAAAIVAECQRTAGCGPWSDRLRDVMTDEETTFVIQLWQTLPGHYSFAGTLLKIRNGQ